MLAWTSNPSLLLASLILVGAQLVAALPWLYAIDPKGFRRAVSDASALGYAIAGFLAAVVLGAGFLGYKGESASLDWYGRYVYGAVLHLQLLIALFLLMPQALVRVWPKGGAVAMAAYREGWRQPLFWLILIAATVAIWASVVIPYFTFGEDYKMMKQIGFDVIMLAAVLFGVLASSMSISEEIEGRTAVTLMSKPINRRQFLIGKFLGILMACLALSLTAEWSLIYALRAEREFDPINNAADPNDVLANPTDKVVDPMTLEAARWLVPSFEASVPTPAGKAIARGAGLWFGDALAHAIGMMLGFGQVMILVAVATALATRVPFIVNVVLCMMVYFLGHLAPVVLEVARQGGGGGAGAELVKFLAQLFSVVLPALEYFNMGPAIIRESALPLGQFAWYVFTVFLYSVIYTVVALLVGLLLFEDRDLA